MKLGKLLMRMRRTPELQRAYDLKEEIGQAFQEGLKEGLENPDKQLAEIVKKIVEAEYAQHPEGKI